MRAVSPFMRCLLVSAPAARSAATQSIALFSAAKISGVSPPTYQKKHDQSIIIHAINARYATDNPESLLECIIRKSAITYIPLILLAGFALLGTLRTRPTPGRAPCTPWRTSRWRCRGPPWRGKTRRRRGSEPSLPRPLPNRAGHNTHPRARAHSPTIPAAVAACWCSTLRSRSAADRTWTPHRRQSRFFARKLPPYYVTSWNRRRSMPCSKQCKIAENYTSKRQSEGDDCTIFVTRKIITF